MISSYLFCDVLTSNALGLLFDIVARQRVLPCTVYDGLQHRWSFLPFPWLSNRLFPYCWHVPGSLDKNKEARCLAVLTEQVGISIAIVTYTVVFACAQTKTADLHMRLKYRNSLGAI